MKTALWIIALFIIIHLINDLFLVPTFFRLFTSMFISFFGYMIYKKYIPENWK